MRFTCVSVSPAALGKIRRAIRKSCGKETGGPMVGWTAADGILRVVDVSGPGEAGTCGKYMVTIDGDHSQRFCDAAFYRSKGRIDFVGDWHCHPSYLIRPSQGDVEAMRLLASVPGLPDHPVSLIHSAFLPKFKVFRLDREQLTRLRLLQWEA